MPKKIDPQKKERAKSLYVSGLPAREVANNVQLSVNTITSWAERGNWSDLRQEIDRQSENLLVDRIAEDRAKATIDMIDPMISRLTMLAEKILTIENEDLRAKDVLHPLSTMLKLRSKLKAEVTQKHEINTNTAIFMQILQAAENIPKELVSSKEYKLIE